jgi:hypothetical protein
MRGVRTSFCALLLLLATAGCDSTSLLLTVDDATHGVPIAALRVTLFAAGRLGAPHVLALAGHPLPGTLGLSGLDVALGHDFRVLVDGLDGTHQLIAQGAKRIALVPGHQSRASLSLMPGALPDSSGYGVPDVINDCPGGDDNQPVCVIGGRDASGAVDQSSVATSDLGAVSTKPGDADLSVTLPPDLALVNGRDLSAPADLSGLSAPPDLSSPPDLLVPRDLTVPHDLTVPPDLTQPPPPDLSVGASCPPIAYACDDFESGDFASPPWDAASPSPLVTVGTGHAHLGSFAASVRFVANQGNFASRKMSIGAMSVGSVGVRAWARFNAKPSETVYFLEVGTTGLRVGSAVDPANGVVWSVNNVNGGQLHTSNSPVPGNQYQCVELTFDYSDDHLQLFVDGASVIDLYENSNPPPSIDGLLMGVLSTTNAINNTVFVDDVAIGAGRLGCK